MTGLNHIFSVAPMMDWTDSHCRVLHRALTRRTLLYTEMVTADAILQPLHVEIDNRRNVEGQKLRNKQPSDYCQTKRLARVRNFPVTKPAKTTHPRYLRNFTAPMSVHISSPLNKLSL